MDFQHSPILISILQQEKFDEEVKKLMVAVENERRCYLSSHPLPHGLKTHFKPHDRYIHLTTANPLQAINESVRAESYDILILDTRSLAKNVIETFIRDTKEEDKHAIIACGEDDTAAIQAATCAIKGANSWNNGVAIGSILFLGALSLHSLFQSSVTTPIGLALMSEPVEVALPLFLFLVALLMGIILYLVQHNHSNISFRPSELQLKPKKIALHTSHKRFKPFAKA